MPATRRLGRLLLWLAIAAAVVYAVGGADGYRTARRWVRRMLRPPTAAQMERAGADTGARAQAAAPPALPSGAAVYGTEPPSALTMGGVVLAVIGGALVLAYVTGRRRDHT